MASNGKLLTKYSFEDLASLVANSLGSAESKATWSSIVAKIREDGEGAIKSMVNQDFELIGGQAFQLLEELKNSLPSVE